MNLQTLRAYAFSMFFIQYISFTQFTAGKLQPLGVFYISLSTDLMAGSNLKSR